MPVNGFVAFLGRAARAAGDARSFFTAGRSVRRPGRAGRRSTNRWARGTHDRHRPGPGRGTAGERRHGGAAGRPRARFVHLPLRARDHRRGRRPAAVAGRPGRLGQRGRPARTGAGRRDRARAGPARDLRPRQRLGRPRRCPAARPSADPARHSAPPAAPRPAPAGQLRQPGPLPRRPRPGGRAAATARADVGRTRIPRRPARPGDVLAPGGALGRPGHPPGSDERRGGPCGNGCSGSAAGARGRRDQCGDGGGAGDADATGRGRAGRLRRAARAGRPGAGRPRAGG